MTGVSYMDHDFLTSLPTGDSHATHHPFTTGEHHALSDAHHFSVNHCLSTDDPLAHAHKIKVAPLHFEYVKPHWVDGYVRSDGTHVQGYLRDGDGDTTKFDGDGYFRNK